MGGFGSGRPRQYQYLEELARIDALACRHALDDLRPGDSPFQQWPVDCITIRGRKCSAAVKAGSVSVWLNLSQGSTPWFVEQDILVKDVPCHFGGYRPLFQCHRCWNNARFLYLRSGRSSFVCRACTDLLYRTQSVDDDQQSQIAIAKIQSRLAKKCAANKLGPYDLPSKPPWMRWHTYEKSIARLNRQHDRRDDLFERKAIGVMGRLLNKRV
jgi:hypothetical protein